MKQQTIHTHARASESTADQRRAQQPLSLHYGHTDTCAPMQHLPLLQRCNNCKRVRTDHLRKTPEKGAASGPHRTRHIRPFACACTCGNGSRTHLYQWTVGYPAKPKTHCIAAMLRSNSRISEHLEWYQTRIIRHNTGHAIHGTHYAVPIWRPASANRYRALRGET